MEIYILKQIKNQYYICFHATGWERLIQTWLIQSHT